MNIDFKALMAKKSDEELINIVTVDREGYQALGVEAAEQEIRNRNIDTEKIELVKATLMEKLEAQKAFDTQFDTQKVGLMARFINYLVDTLIFGILLLLLGELLELILPAPDPNSESIVILFIALIVFFGYYVIMESKFQKTIGKYLTKTKVVNSNGTKPEIGDIFRRTACRLIPFDRFSFLFVSSGFHDKLSDTLVIRDVN